MNTIYYKDYIDKLLYLESNDRMKPPPKHMEPFSFSNTKEIIEIQKAASKLRTYAGLNNLTFIVSYTNLKKNTGGQVELGFNEEVLIDISDDLVGSSKSILATIAHEISHKYLHINKLAINSFYENEVLTDLTAIYIGFGKIMLNGRLVRNEIQFGKDKYNNDIKVGYLTWYQLSFIYLTISKLRGIKRKNYMSGIDSNVQIIIKGLEKKYKIYFKNLSNHYKLQKKINRARIKISYLDKLIRIIDCKSSFEIKSFILNEFERLSLIEKTIYDKKKSCFIQSIEDIRSYKKTRKQIPKITIDGNKLRELIKINKKYIRNSQFKNFVRQSDTINKIQNFSCPSCHSKLSSKRPNCGILFCPYCRFHFAADTLLTVKNMNIIKLLL